MVNIYSSSNTGAVILELTVGGVIASRSFTGFYYNNISTIVPPGAIYSAAGLVAGYLWTELR